MEKAYNHFVLIVFGGFFILLSGLFCIFYLELSQKEKLALAVENSHGICLSAEKLLSFLKDAESAQERYLTTKDPHFLEISNSSWDSTWANAGTIRRLTVDSGEQKELLAQLTKLLSQQRIFLQENLILYSNAPQYHSIFWKQSESLSKKIQDISKTIVANEENLLANKTFEYKKYSSLTIQLLWVIQVTILVYFAFSFLYYRRLIKKQRRFEFKLQAKNQELHAFSEEQDALNEELRAANEKIISTVDELSATNEELTLANETIMEQSKQLIRQSEERLNDVLNSINEIVSVTDINTMELMFTNDACFDVLGYPKKAFYDDPLIWRKIMHPDDLPRVLEERTKIFDKEVILVEFRVYKPDKSIVWLESKARIKRNSEGTPIRIDTVSRDITHRKEAQQLLQLSEKKYKYLFEHNPIPYWIVDLETGQFIDANLATCHLFGYELDELLNLKIEELGITVPLISNHTLSEMAKPEEKTFRTVNTHKRKNGSIFFGEIFAEKISYNYKQACIGLTLDVTERTEIEREKELLTKELIEKNNDLEEFAYVISHNLRSPVANILGLINIINLNPYSQEDTDYALRKLQTAGNTLDKIVRDMNEILSCRDEKTGQKILTKIDLESETHEIIESIESMILSCGAHITCDFSLAPLVLTFKPYFHNIMINLISNALKYHSPERYPILTIESSVLDKFICISVKDNGLGMDMHLAKNKIFKLYNRFHPHIDGKGIGLYLVKNQITALGGKIEFSSQLDIGTEFKVYFPNLLKLNT